MAFSREQIKIAKRDKLPLVQIRVDERYCDPPGGSVEMAGVVTQAYADLVSKLRRKWPHEEGDDDDWSAESWKSAALTTLALAFCLGVTYFGVVLSCQH